MSLFDVIKKAIFHNPLAPHSGSGTSAPPAPPATPTAVPAVRLPGTPVVTTNPAAGTVSLDSKSSSAPPHVVDVEAVLEQLNEKGGQRLNWRTSIVDLMKLVGLDSSLANRKELATELGYTGDKNDSAAMNIWLHKAVMKKLSENGGKVPASLQ